MKTVLLMDTPESMITTLTVTLKGDPASIGCFISQGIATLEWESELNPTSIVFSDDTIADMCVKEYDKFIAGF